MASSQKIDVGWDKGIHDDFDFSSIKGYPNELPLHWVGNILIYKGDKDQVYLHICNFLDHISKYEEVLEDIMLKGFYNNFDDNVKI